MKLYLKSKLSLLQTAQRFLAHLSSEGWTMQKRDGLNLGGGLYYLFTKDETEVILCQNHNDVEVPEASDFDMYAWVYGENANAIHVFGNVAEAEALEYKYMEFL